MALKRKAQSSIEFMTMITLAVLVFTVFFVTFSQKKAQAFDEQTRLKAKSVVERVAYYMDLSLVQGDGFEKKFDMPREIGGEDYDIVIYEVGSGIKIYLEWSNTSVTTNSAAPKLYGEIRPGTNTIKNNESVIYVS